MSTRLESSKLCEKRTSAISESEDSVRSEESKVLVDEKTSSRVLLVRDLVHQILGNLTSSVSGSPINEK